MPTISGPLWLVTEEPAVASSVEVRAYSSRPHRGGLLTDFAAQVPVNVSNGQVSFTCAPGPAVLLVVYGGHRQEAVPIVVAPSPANQSLESVVRAGATWGGRSPEELGAIVQQIQASVGGADRLVLQMDGYRRAAETSASVAAGAASAAEDARDEAGEFRDQAAASAGTASAASVSALGHAQTAGQHAGAAAQSASYAQEMSDAASDSAKEAGAAAKQAEDVVENTRFDGDRLVVHGKTSQPLTGPRGPKGQDGTVMFETLSPAQREEIRGPEGPPGPRGPAGVWADSVPPPPGDGYLIWLDTSGEA